MVPIGNGSCFGTPPSALTVYIIGADVLENMVEENITDFPSGVHPNTGLGDGWYVNRFGTPPSAGTVKTS
jgi:hypothetical protein